MSASLSSPCSGSGLRGVFVVRPFERTMVEWRSLSAGLACGRGGNRHAALRRRSLFPIPAAARRLARQLRAFLETSNPAVRKLLDHLADKLAREYVHLMKQAAAGTPVTVAPKGGHGE